MEIQQSDGWENPFIFGMQLTIYFVHLTISNLKNQTEVELLKGHSRLPLNFLNFMPYDRSWMMPLPNFVDNLPKLNHSGENLSPSCT